MPANITAQLPQDVDSRPIQVLSPAESSVANLAIGATTDRVALPSGAQIVEVASQDICRMAFGTSAVEATNSSRLVPAGVTVYKVPTGATHLAAIRVGSSTGAITITKLV